jgi:hypothetical protein
MSEVTKHSPEPAQAKAPRDQRRSGGDDERPSGINGMRAGLSGDERRGLFAAWLGGIMVTTPVVLMNIANRRAMLPGEPPAMAWVDEVTSLAALAVAYLSPLLAALVVRRRGRPWLASAPWMFAALAVFVILHIGVAGLLRVWLYPHLVGEAHDLGWLREHGLGEVAKDLAIFGVAFWIGVYVLAWRTVAPPARQTTASPETFDIQDGSRLIRTPVAEILAVRSAGNYAEFQLSDGRRPLMRTSLSALHEALKGAGFVRTHRSWLVNARRVTGLRPEGSGDYAVELGEIEAPLSRRFPTALSLLRG